MANRDMQKKVKADRAKKHARKSVVTKTTIIVLIILAITSAILLPILLSGKDKDSEVKDSSITLDYQVLNLGNTASCDPCRRIKPVVDGLKTKYSGVIQFNSYDIYNPNKGASLARKYSVVSMPTLVFLYKGTEVYRTEGYRTTEEIESILSSLGWI